MYVSNKRFLDEGFPPLAHIVIYNGNNSGGSFWLNRKHFKALENAGWRVDWVAKPIFRENYHKEDIEMGSYLRTEAHTAYLVTNSLRKAIESWEEAVGMDASREGCNCCGPPHSFYMIRLEHPEIENYTTLNSVSGSEVLPILYEDAPTSLRDTCKKKRTDDDAI